MLLFCFVLFHVEVHGLVPPQSALVVFLGRDPWRFYTDCHFIRNLNGSSAGAQVPFAHPGLWNDFHILFVKIEFHFDYGVFSGLKSCPQRSGETHGHSKLN